MFYIDDPIYYTAYEPETSINEAKYKKIIDIMIKALILEELNYSIIYTGFKDNINENIINKYVPGLYEKILKVKKKYNHGIKDEDIKSYIDIITKIYEKWPEMTEKDLFDLWLYISKPSIVWYRLMIKNKNIFMKNINVILSKKNYEKYWYFFTRDITRKDTLYFLVDTYIDNKLPKDSILTVNDILEFLKIWYNIFLPCDMYDWWLYEYLEGKSNISSYKNKVEAIKKGMNAISSSIKSKTLKNEKEIVLNNNESEEEEKETIATTNLISFFKLFDDKKEKKETVKKVAATTKQEKSRIKRRVFLLEWTEKKGLIEKIIKLYIKKVENNKYIDLLRNIDLLYNIYNSNTEQINKILNNKVWIPKERIKIMYEKLFKEVLNNLTIQEKDNSVLSWIINAISFWIIDAIDNKKIDYKNIIQILNPFLLAIYKGNITLYDILLKNEDKIKEIIPEWHNYSNIALPIDTNISMDNLITISIKSWNIKMVQKIVTNSEKDPNKEKFPYLKISETNNNYLHYIIDDIKNIKEIIKTENNNLDNSIELYLMNILDLFISSFGKKEIANMLLDVNNYWFRPIDMIADLWYEETFKKILTIFKNDKNILSDFFNFGNKNNFLFLFTKDANSLNIIKYLIQKYSNYMYANKFLKDKEGNNLVLNAIKHGNNEIAQFLIEQGYSYYTTIDNRMKDAFTLSAEKNNENMIKYLLQKADNNKDIFNFLFNIDNNNKPINVSIIEALIRTNNLKLLKEVLDFEIRWKAFDEYIAWKEETWTNTRKSALVLFAKNQKNSDNNDELQKYLQTRWVNEIKMW